MQLHFWVNLWFMHVYNFIEYYVDILLLHMNLFYVFSCDCDKCVLERNPIANKAMIFH